MIFYVLKASFWVSPTTNNAAEPKMYILHSSSRLFLSRFARFPSAQRSMSRARTHTRLSLCNPQWPSYRCHIHNKFFCSRIFLPDCIISSVQYIQPCIPPPRQHYEYFHILFAFFFLPLFWSSVCAADQLAAINQPAPLTRTTVFTFNAAYVRIFSHSFKFAVLGEGVWDSRRHGVNDLSLFFLDGSRQRQHMTGNRIIQLPPPC